MTESEERIRNDLTAQIEQPVRAVRAIPEGHSGFTYWVELDGHRGVLRLPPPGARIAGPADIPRQARIMAALHAQGMPVPAIMATSHDPAVDLRRRFQAVPLDTTGIGGEDPVPLEGEVSRWTWLIDRAPVELS